MFIFFKFKYRFSASLFRNREQYKQSIYILLNIKGL